MTADGLFFLNDTLVIAGRYLTLGVGCCGNEMEVAAGEEHDAERGLPAGTIVVWVTVEPSSSVPVMKVNVLFALVAVPAVDEYSGLVVML